MNNNNILDKIQNKKKIFEVFQGKFKLPPPLTLIPPPKEFIPSSKVVVFDLDETLGSFSDLYLLWTGIKHICPEFNDFNALLDLYPEFLRYNILLVLKYLYKKKVENKCDKIYIYTNNQCLSREWVSLIIHYFNTKINSTSLDICLFDQVISAFKIGNTNIELSRTTHEKTYTDLISCTMLPKNTEICFIDDTEFVKMKQDKVYYIHPKAYVHSLTASQIIDRCIQSGILLNSGLKLITSSTYWLNWFSLHKRNFVANPVLDIDIDTNILITKKIMSSIREFFILSTYYENKHYHHLLNTSRKISCSNNLRRSTKKFFTPTEVVVPKDLNDLVSNVIDDLVSNVMVSNVEEKEVEVEVEVDQVTHVEEVTPKVEIEEVFKQELEVEVDVEEVFKQELELEVEVVKQEVEVEVEEVVKQELELEVEVVKQEVEVEEVTPVEKKEEPVIEVLEDTNPLIMKIEEESILQVTTTTKNKKKNKKTKK